jgi:diguanylate cyclase (GGDEF)-like protein
MRAARRRGGGLAVLCLDLDNFKEINDAFGHLAGDRALRAVAERLTAKLRKTDLIGRFGGDEFAVLLSDIDDAGDAGAVAAKVCDWLAAPPLLDGSEIHLSASIGIAIGRMDLANAEEMLRQADLALYRAKQEGGGRYRFHSPDLDDRVRERVSLMEDLRAAILDDQLELHYQPEIADPDMRLVGLEALIRWNHPWRGQLPPAAFIPVAERSEVISVLGRWVLDRVCRQISLWRGAGIAPPRISVNLSPRQLRVPRNFVRDLSAQLAKWDVAPGRIELELAEIVLGPDGRGRLELAGLRSLGLGLAVDDFGAGYSSLEQLKTEGFARLKIAPKFIAASPGGGDAAIVRAAVALAQALDIGVVAKGVETQAQRDVVRAAGCERMQGYYFSPPVTAECATELLRRGHIAPNSRRPPEQACPPM